MGGWTKAALHWKSRPRLGGGLVWPEFGGALWIGKKEAAEDGLDRTVKGLLCHAKERFTELRTRKKQHCAGKQHRSCKGRACHPQETETISSNAQDDLAPQLPLLHSHVIRVDLDGSEVSPVIFVIHTASNNG